MVIPVDVLKRAYLEASAPVRNIQSLALALRHWYQAFPHSNYLQPCLIEGSAALVCRHELGLTAPKAAAALRAICRQYRIRLKEDGRAASHRHSAHPQNRRGIALVLTFCLTVVSATAQAGNLADASHAAAPVVMKIQNQSLADVALTISRRTGAVFKFDAAVEGDKIDKNLNAADWAGAIGQLLQNYNYTLVRAGDTVKTVFVSGYKGGHSPYLTNPSAESITVSDPLLPESIEVDLPVDALRDMPVDSSVDVVLPMGVFVVEQASVVAFEDGTLSWVGTMDCEEAFCRLYLLSGPDGELMGNVFTGQAEYDIETVDGHTLMSAASHPGYAAANY